MGWAALSAHLKDQVELHRIKGMVWTTKLGREIQITSAGFVQSNAGVWRWKIEVRVMLGAMELEYNLPFIIDIEEKHFHVRGAKKFDILGTDGSILRTSWFDYDSVAAMKHRVTQLVDRKVV